MKLPSPAPYQIFFPLGILFALAGTLLWPLFVWLRLPVYPGQLHADWMMGGFILSFVTGFLLTAIPKYTGAKDARPSENATALFLLIALSIAGLKVNIRITHGLELATIAFLLIFSVRRFASRQYDPPASFVFVGMGLMAGLIGVSLLLVDHPQLVHLGRILYYHGMILSLVIGVGGKLLPALFGIYNPSLVQLSSLRGDSSSTPLTLFRTSRLPILATVLLVGFVIEGAISPQAGALIQAVVYSIVAITLWRLHRRPAARGTLPFCLWLSAWSIAAGLWGQALFPQIAIHAIHLAYIGGFGLMVLMIAARVTLAHGGYGLELEHRSKIIAWSSGLVLLAALTRATAILSPQIYLSHLAYAGTTWAVAWILWAWLFLPRILRLPRTLKK